VTGKLRVAVIFGGRSAEHEISLQSAASVIAALDPARFEVVPLAITRQGHWLPPGESLALLPAGALASSHALAPVSGPAAGLLALDGAGPSADRLAVDVVFPVLHGPWGEDGTVQGLLELCDLPYVGSGVLGSALGMDKAVQKDLLSRHGLPVVDYLLLTRRFRAAAVASGTFAVTVLVPFAAMPRASRLYWLGGLFLNPKRLGNVHYVGNQSLYGALLRLLGSAAAARPYQLLADVLIGLGGLALATWAYRRGQEMAGVLVCALTGLLVSPVSWSHHWVWIAPMLVALTDFATRPPSLAAAVRWRRRCWLCAAAAAVVFSGLIWAVPSPAVQGYVMTVPQQLIGDLYVLAGLAGLGVIAALMVSARRGDQRLVMPAVARDGGEPLEPGLAAQP